MMKSKLIVLSIILLNTCILFAQAEPTTLIHKVAEKENLYRIALKYGTNIQRIEAMNPTLKSEKIKIGMKLNVPVPAEGIAAILPGPAIAPKVGPESALKIQTKNSIETFVEKKAIKPSKIITIKEEKLMQNEAREMNNSDTLPLQKTGKVITKTLNTSFEKSETLSLDFTHASSAEERKNELLQLAKRDCSIIVVKTLEGSKSFIATEEPEPLQLLATAEQKPTYMAEPIPKPVHKINVEDKDVSNPPSAASLRKVLMAAERGEDLIVNLQIIMKDGAVICVTDPSVQLQMMSELLQVQR